MVLRKVDVSRRHLSGVVVEMPVMRGLGHVDICGGQQIESEKHLKML